MTPWFPPLVDETVAAQFRTAGSAAQATVGIEQLGWPVVVFAGNHYDAGALALIAASPQLKAEHRSEFSWDYLGQVAVVWRVRIGRV